MITAVTKTFVTTEREAVWITTVYGTDAKTGESSKFDIEATSRLCEWAIRLHAKERGLLPDTIAWDEQETEVVTTRVFYPTIYQTGSNAAALPYR